MHTCKVHTVLDYYDEIGLSSYAHLIIFMFLGDDQPACLFDLFSRFNQDLSMYFMQKSL